MSRKVNYEVTCRYGITYNVELHGSAGAKQRTADMLGKCCCWVCHNHNCKEPRNERVSCAMECFMYGAKSAWCAEPVEC